VVDDFMFLFGGIDEKRQYRNDMYKLDLDNLSWTIIPTKGKSPEGRVNHEMRLINNNKIFVIGGIQGQLSNIDKIFSDIFIYNIGIIRIK
jgi:N-acetylneuraminic acid mutarotase